MLNMASGIRYRFWTQAAESKSKNPKFHAIFTTFKSSHGEKMGGHIFSGSIRKKAS